MGEQEETTKLRAQHLLMMRQEEERTAAAAKLLAHPGLNVAAAPRSENSQMAVRLPKTDIRARVHVVTFRLLPQAQCTICPAHRCHPR